MKHRTLVLIATTALAVQATAQVPEVAPRYQDTLNQVEASYRSQAQAFADYALGEGADEAAKAAARADSAARGRAMRDFATPILWQVSRPGAVVSEDQVIFTGHGEQRIQRSTADADGALQLVEESTQLLGPPMGLELRGEGPTGEVVAGFRQDLAETPVDLSGTFRDVAGRINTRLYPHVVQQMQRFPDPAELSRDDDGALTPESRTRLADWHHFYSQAGGNYLRGLDIYGVELPRQVLASLGESRRRFDEAGRLLQAAPGPEADLGATEPELAAAPVLVAESVEVADPELDRAAPAAPKQRQSFFGVDFGL